MKAALNRYNKALFLLGWIVLSQSFHANSQGYQDQFGYFGLCANYYTVGLTPLEIYRYDVNHASSTSNTFGTMRIAPGIIWGTTIGEGNIKGKLEYTFNRRVVRADYQAMNPSDQTIYDVQEKLKYSHTLFKVGIHTVPKSLKRLSLGGSIDIGLFNNRIKRTGGNLSGNWGKFLTQTGLTTDFVSRQPLAGVSIYCGILVTDNVQLSVSKQFLILDAQYNYLSNLKDFYVNTQNIQFSIAYVY